MHIWSLEEKSKSEKLYLALTLLIRISLLIAILGAVWERAWMALFVSSISFLLSFLPLFIKRTYKINLPGEIQVIIVLFIYAALFLGMAREWYARFRWWDSMMHGFSGVALGFTGFMILYILHKSGKLEASPSLIVLFSFCFAVAMGALWEMLEFGIDTFYASANMQRTRTVVEVLQYNSTRIVIYDTMWDIILDAAGAFLASLGGYLYLKKGEFFLLDRLVKKFEEVNPELFKRRRRKHTQRSQ